MRMSAVAKKFKCPNYGLLIKDIGKERCIENSSDSKNNRAICCSINCPSPWRVCLPCINQGALEGRNGRKIHSVSRETGYCGFHKKHGPEVVWSGNGKSAKKAKSKKSSVESARDIAESFVSKHSGGKVDEVRSKIGRKSEADKEKEAKTLDKIKKEVERMMKTRRTISVKVDEVEPFKGQPRKYFDQEAIEELRNCMNIFGQIIDIMVRPADKGSKYKWMLIDGERRWRSAKKNGEKTLRAVALDVKDTKIQRLMSFVANLARASHVELEVAESLRQLRIDFNFSGPTIAAALNRKPNWVYRQLKLLKLDPRVQKLMDRSRPREERLSRLVAEQLIYFSHGDQYRIAKDVIRRKMSNSQAGIYIRKEAKKLRVKMGERSPKNEYKIFDGFLTRTEQHLIELKDLGFDAILLMFKFRDSADKAAVKRKIESIIKYLNEVKLKI
ncbi:putative chromosome-partitioning protein ParB [bacterium BMS3Abin15]|nr:putative chromosome-partitioning protein ParB [bacterium BMS3Abin15]HDZ85216.1 ParB/RepB/Spo0J family partition protein [Candidatus Moranbacteria bacterium]